MCFFGVVVGVVVELDVRADLDVDRVTLLVGVVVPLVSDPEEAANDASPPTE